MWSIFNLAVVIVGIFLFISAAGNFVGLFSTLLKNGKVNLTLLFKFFLSTSLFVLIFVILTRYADQLGIEVHKPRAEWTEEERKHYDGN